MFRFGLALLGLSAATHGYVMPANSRASAPRRGLYSYLDSISDAPAAPASAPPSNYLEEVERWAAHAAAPTASAANGVRSGIDYGAGYVSVVPGASAQQPFMKANGASRGSGPSSSSALRATGSGQSNGQSNGQSSGGRAPTNPTQPSTPAPGASTAPTALIIQNKGGGHGELGFHLAKALAGEQGMKVVIINEGDAKDKEPFRSYHEIESLGGGVTVHWVDPKNTAAVDKAIGGASFDYVYDNWSKSPEDASHVANKARAWGVKNFVFVSSAGMYTPSEEFPMIEKEPTKTTGQREVEMLLDQLNLPWSSFRPQYIYGPKANKRDYMDWFFDRISRDRPLPIPGSGQQVTTLTDARDVAGMLAAVPAAGPAAAKQVFNCASGRVYTIDGIAQLCAKTMGKDPKSLVLKHYDPKALSEAPPKKAFPFRNAHFGVSAGKARRTLNWNADVTLEQGMEEWWNNYKLQGRHMKDVNFSIDDAILKELA